MKTKISYASEEGLKELYRRAVSRIPDVDTELDYYSENPIANSTVTNALANLASYLVVPGTGSDHHPNIPSGTESEMVLYFVKVASEPGKDNYKEWIWTGNWECIGEPSIVVDDSLDINSMNPITNHAVTEAMLNFGGFEKVNGTGADNHPDVANPSNKVIYLVEVPGTPEPDHCMEWIWEASGQWVCIGSTSIEVDTELDPVSGNPLANSTITAEIDRIDTRIDDEHEYTEGEVERLETIIAEEHEYTAGEVSRLDTRVDNEHDYIVREVNRLDTRIDELSLVITDVDGTISGTTMSVFVDNSTYTRFAVPVSVETLIITLADRATAGNVSRSMFEFTLPEDTSLEHVSVLDATGSECLMFAPMTWPGLVTYQGEVIDSIAKIIGFSPVVPEENVLCTEDGTNIVTGDRKKLRYRIVED